jgi:hypothetical protein
MGGCATVTSTEVIGWLCDGEDVTAALPGLTRPSSDVFTARRRICVGKDSPRQHGNCPDLLFLQMLRRGPSRDL